MNYNFINNRKLISKIIVLALVIIMLIPTGCANTQSNFNDIKGHWAEKTITEWLEKGYIKGYPNETFKPNEPITKAEFITLINRSISFSGTGEVEFRDVRSSDWFYKDLQIAANNYINGFPDNTFRPYDLVSREQAASIVASINELTDNNEVAKKFYDYRDISDWAKGHVGAVVSAELMQGIPNNNFLPKFFLTRAEAVVVLQNLMISLNQTILESILVTGVKLDKIKVEAVEGETVKLLRLIEPINASNKAVQWSSSDSSIATVDNNGLVSTIKPGTVTITVTTTDGAKTDSCIITVKKTPPLIASNIKVTANVRDAEITPPTDIGGYLIELEFTDGAKIQELSMLEVMLYKDSINLVTNSLAFDRIDNKAKKSSAITCQFNLGTIGNSLWSWNRGVFPAPNPLDDSVVPNKVIVNFTIDNIEYTFTKDVSLRLPVVQDLQETTGK